MPERRCIVKAVFFIRVLLWDVNVGVNAQPRHHPQHDPLAHLKQQAYSAKQGSQEQIDAWRQVLKVDPQNLEAHVILGWQLFTTPDKNNNALHRKWGANLLEAAFDETRVSPSIDWKFPQTYVIAAALGRWRAEIYDYPAASKFLKIALQLSLRHGDPATSTERGDACIQLTLASLFDFFPSSTKQADEALENMMNVANHLLTDKKWRIDDHALSEAMVGAKEDPFRHCLLGSFYLSFYHQADVAVVAKTQHQLAIRGWPQLDRTAPFVREWTAPKTCVDRKIKIAVISATMSEGHSVSEDFGGVLQRLDRNLFEITYIYVLDGNAVPFMALFTQRHPEDRKWTWQKEERDQSDGAWLVRWGNLIANEQFDMIYYLDLTMSSFVRRLGMQRLAPVQLTSHGHPITSGIPSSVVQFYISWDAAELPYEKARKHYSEELKLIPGDQLHQYYEPRLLPGNQRSRMDGQSFADLTRKDLGLPLNNTSTNIYLCMQKPFKMHAEFDPLVCGIVQQDPNAVIVLHKETSPVNQIVFEDRLRRAGCGSLDRIMFFEVQPHHRLLALYREATVVLDSYPAGGCTTTREVLEMGKALVTLPSRLLGGRWTLGYLMNLGLKESTRRALIASTPDEYINLAVQLGTNEILRNEVEADLKKCLPNLFGSHEAVVAWQNLLLGISPVQPCPIADRGNHEL